MTRLKWIVKKSSMKIGNIGRRNESLEVISKFQNPLFSEKCINISHQNLLENLVLGFVVWHSVVDLNGVHDKDVADDGNDELRDPIGVTGEQEL